MNKDKFAREVEILEFWENNNIFQKVNSKNKGLKKFNFVEGPPYPTGDAHLGHLRNWAIKDCVLRFRRFCGEDVYARDGYDVHGLPVENKVQNKLNLKTVDDLKEFGVENFLRECKKYISEIINDMKGVRSRYGLWLDPNQYQTSHPDYISSSWMYFKKAQEKGLLYKDYKTVAWCPNDETTLSDYEIKDTYKVLDDPSIYVKFPLCENERTTQYEESLVIWTTTPWTLQSDMAIAMHPKFSYAKVLVELNGKKEVLIIAQSLVENVIEKISKSNDIKLVSILEVKLGIEFEGVRYVHIYMDETPSQKSFVRSEHKHIHSVIMADFVTLNEQEDIFDKLDKRGYKHSDKKEDERENDEEVGEGVNEDNSKELSGGGSKSDGTGLVHIAPGHGFDDYEIGKKYNIPIFCPVDGKGNFSEGKYEGMYFKDVDSVAISYLKEKGFLLHNEIKSHRYPCCWRCKTPIVYRAADQWWIKRSEITGDIIKENSNVKWFPQSAKASFNNLMESAGDWAISRQRYWGIPLPIWEDEDGNYEVIGSKEELEKRCGKSFDDLHIDDLEGVEFANEKSGKVMRRVPFIADVWFDSGCASFASHYGEGLSFDEIIKKYYPISWITEGEDQIRGWFSSLFNVGYVVCEKAPYNQVLFYRYVMDKNGVKMSKSLGNGIDGVEAINRWGSDATRYYLLTKRATEDVINFDPDEFSIVYGFFNTLENVFKFCNSYLGEYSVNRTPSVSLTSLDSVHMWILYRLNSVVESFELDMEHFRLNVAFKEVESFIVNDFSKVYLKLVKDICESRDEDLIFVLNEVLRKSLVMLSCAIPFKAEALYQDSFIFNKRESVFLESFPSVDSLLVKKVCELEVDSNFELAREVIGAVLNARERTNIGVRWPLSQIDIGSGVDLSSKLLVFEGLIKKLTNVSKVSYDLGEIDFSYIVKPNFSELKRDFDNPSSVISAINKNKDSIAKDLKDGNSNGVYDGLEIDFERHIIKEMSLSDELVSSDFSCGNVILHTHQDEILLEQGYLRELIRRVQSIRKDLGLNKSDLVNISFEGSDDYYMELAFNCSSLIKGRVGAEDILSHSLGKKFEFEIKGKKLVVSMEKV